jgi:hypothetical protein
MAARRETRLRDLPQLKALGVTTGWAAPYVLLGGYPHADRAGSFIDGRAT